MGEQHAICPALRPTFEQRTQTAPVDRLAVQRGQPEQIYNRRKHVYVRGNAIDASGLQALGPSQVERYPSTAFVHAALAEGWGAD